MALISRQELERLVAEAQPPCVSIYLPTHRAGREVRQDPIRFKNLLREAEERLGVRSGDRGADADLLAPARRLLAEDLFWRRQGEGLAVFAAEGLFRTYHLPLAVEEYVEVNQRFYLKPLLPLLVGDGRFYVLALSLKGGVRLFEGTRFSMREVDVGENAPSSVEEFFAEGGPLEDALQFRTFTRGSQRDRSAIHHGHGEGEDALDDEIVQYLRRIDEVVIDLLPAEQPPLVIAAVEYLIGHYRLHSHYRNIMPRGVDGNPDALSADELHRHAWAIVEPVFSSSEKAALEKFFDLKGAGMASEDLQDIVIAAHDGRVETLFVDLQAREWGQFDRGSRLIAPSEREEGEDLLDLAAFRSLANNGKVYGMARDRLPGNGPVAAIFRY